MTTNDSRPASAASSPSSPHHIIRTLAVSDGFLKGAAFDFVDGLNVIIGVRGSGKSTSLSFIRYVLDNAAAARSNALRALVKDNLCGGRIQLGVSTKYGVSYTGERRYDEPLAVLDAQGAACNVSLDRDGVFGADIYSHNELEQIAKTPRLQLDLIDRFIDVDVRRIAVEARRVEHELHGTATELQRLTEEERELNDRTSEVAALEAKLAALQTVGGPNGEALARAHAAHALRAREVRAIEELETSFVALRKESVAVAESLRRRVGVALDAELTAGPNGPTMKAVDARRGAARERIDALLADAAGQCERMLTDLVIDKRKLAEAHRGQDAEYRTLVERSKEHAGVTAERDGIQKRLAILASAKKTLLVRQSERAACEQQRRQLFGALSALRDERFALRKKVADDLTAKLEPTIRVSIAQAQNRAKYREILVEALKGTSMKQGPVADRICAALAPDELFALVQQGDDARLVERLGLDEERAKKAASHLRNSEAIYDIEAVELDDDPCVELRDGEFKRSDTLSPGQRCTAILPILLLESDRPLIIDQPEDNLDNRFISSTIAKALRAAQKTRQLIFVTHNANVPVLGDAQRVFVLESDGQRARIVKFGTVDHTKEEIESILDGGRDAFLWRKQVYGH